MYMYTSISHAIPPLSRSNFPDPPATSPGALPGLIG